MKNIQNQKFTQLFIILISLFIFIFFTRGLYSDLIGNKDISEEQNKIYKEKIDELDYLSTRKKELDIAKKGGEQTKEYLEIKKYLEPITEDKIIEEIYGAVSNRINGGIKILSLSMTEGVKNELGFNESKINISLIVKDEETIKDLFDYLNKDSKYKIFVNSFNMPKQTSTLGYRIQIPATIFYVDSK
ncbi:MAG: hypothetical protein Q9M94_02685 [Candidatus Gracilibacteria bacterium]|nr:hypothetical protein [Candidatus Gracilibacteria bacterium]MDQ7022228.1 hypothetical protein [Candidatus Gracilibacteria bacterium]